MQKEPPDNQIYSDRREDLERPSGVDHQGFNGEYSRREELPDDLAAAKQAVDPKILAPEDTLEAEPDPLVVADPYTAAPPASIFAQADSPFASEGLDEPKAWQDEATNADPFIPLPYSPTSQTDTVRRSGLAWSAGIAFFGSVAFTLFLGWIADLLLGTSPWGIVGGIVLGSIIGFLQFFRITSRIFPPKDNGPEITPLMSHKDDE